MMHGHTYIKYPLFLSSVNETWIFWTDFRKILKYKYYKNVSIWSRFVSWRRMDGRTAGNCLKIDTFPNLVQRLCGSILLPCSIIVLKIASTSQASFFFTKHKVNMLGAAETCWETRRLLIFVKYFVRNRFIIHRTQRIKEDHSSIGERLITL